MNIVYKEDLSTEDYIALRSTTDWMIPPPEQAELGLRGSAAVFAAYDADADDAHAVGMGRVISDGGFVNYIADVIVKSAYQDMGIGTAIMEKLIDAINSRQKPGFICHFYLLSAKGKEPFYERFGFEKHPDPGEHYGFGMAKFH